MLWMTQVQARAIVQHAHADAPHEACGVLVGVNGRVDEVIPIPNAAQNPRQTYIMDERALARALLMSEQRGLSLVAFYHSHPEGDPLPSPTDVRHATYPDTPYLIVGLKGEPRLAAWQIAHGQVTPVSLHIGSSIPTPEPKAAFSTAQKSAILLSALIAFVLVLVLSLTLLPPAPPIP